MLSMESKIPPRPGIKEPESLQFDDRLSTDSTRSPIMEVKPITSPKKIILKIEPAKTSPFHKKHTTPLNTDPAKPPQKPAMLLFGLALIKPLLFFPKSTPKNHANESQKKTMVKKRIKTSFECSKNVNRDTKVHKKPA